jgi:hypothetical protein
MAFDLESPILLVFLGQVARNAHCSDELVKMYDDDRLRS